MSSHRYLSSYGNSYMNSDYLKSEIYLAKGEQAYYKPNDIGGGYKYVNYYTNCQSFDNSKEHSCTWLEIRKTGDPIAQNEELSQTWSDKLKHICVFITETYEIKWILSRILFEVKFRWKKRYLINQVKILSLRIILKTKRLFFFYFEQISCD